MDTSDARMPARKVVIAGGSGSLGRALADDLRDRGVDVVILTRRRDPALRFRQVEWDGVHVGPWAEELADGAHTAVVNLAGRLVDARPTPENIADLRASRVLPTRALVEASRLHDQPLAYWVEGSATAIWSHAGDTHVTESTPLPTGTAALPQMTGIAKPWEAASAGANAAYRVALRTSIVLQVGSPALGRLVGLTRFGLGGRVGSGRQWFSWIPVNDWVGVVRACLGLTPGLTMPDGVLVATAPNPVTNADLMAGLRRCMHRPPALPTAGAHLTLSHVTRPTIYGGSSRSTRRRVAARWVE